MDTPGNDHDLLIEMRTQLTYVIQELQAMRDGMKKDIATLYGKVDALEKSDIALKNDIATLNNASLDRHAANALRITAIEAFHQSGVTKNESNKVYLFRKALEWIMPFIFIVTGLILSKLGILNLQ